MSNDEISQKNKDLFNDLIKRLGIVDLNIFKGPSWNSLSKNERAELIIKILSDFENEKFLEFEGIGDGYLD